MTEKDTHFDSEVKKLVMKKNGGEVTPELFWSITAALGDDVSALIEAVEASNDAGEERHADTLRLLAVHSDEDALHRKEQADLCAETHAKLMRRAPRRRSDPADAMFAAMGRSMADPADSQSLEARESAHPEFTPDQQRTLLTLITGMSLGKKLLGIIISTLVVLIVGLVFSYSVAYFAADRAEQNGIAIEKTALPTPTVTVTVTPSP